MDHGEEIALKNSPDLPQLRAYSEPIARSLNSFEKVALQS
jgi:hypothetical protein